MTETLENIIQAAKDAGNPIKNLDSIAVGLYDDIDEAILYYDGQMYTRARIPKTLIDTQECGIDHIKVWRTWEFNPK